MDLVIRFRSAVALAGRFPVLAGVDLDVARGDVLLLRGANGAGKTSVLRACAGLLRVVGGEASVLGHDLVRDQRAVRRRVGLLGHQTGLYDEMTAADNVRFALRAARVPVSAAGPAMEMLGISGRLASTPVGALSAGQRRRVALAALVARDPELWLLDEPHAGLDAEYRDLLDRLILQAAARGATVVLASHEADRAGALARRTATVAGGVVASTTPSTPSSPAVVTSVA
ncbi:MAG TPA: heme ABC exporter ATP-binding protein CcmA [Acidimicrobiales bacterium]|nr:heme ABC exporter ATP-binding protein CcmA [Acidimicrobiales bacterium]